MIKNIFFDFDGVLAESVNVKTEAFRALYAPFGVDVSDKVVRWHEANGGVSRFEKIKIWHREFLGIQLTEGEINEWADRFSDLALQGVLQSPWVAGADDFLMNHSSSYEKWIISGTPDEEMKQIVRLRGIADLFIGVHGSPRKKTEWSGEIITTFGLRPSETVFIGDARSDYEAANAYDLHFILRETPENKTLFNDFKGPRVNDLSSLEQLLGTL
jgi:phosphoglycolate phosphatase-like HAD superfamily hydrolase